MKKSSTTESSSNRLRSWAQSKAHGGDHGSTLTRQSPSSFAASSPSDPTTTTGTPTISTTAPPSVSSTTNTNTNTTPTTTSGSATATTTNNRDSTLLRPTGNNTRAHSSSTIGGGDGSVHFAPDTHSPPYPYQRNGSTSGSGNNDVASRKINRSRQGSNASTSANTAVGSSSPSSSIPTTLSSTEAAGPGSKLGTFAAGGARSENFHANTLSHNDKNDGENLGHQDSNEKIEKAKEGTGEPNVLVRFIATARQILCYSWFNLLLVFVPIGIAVQCVPGIDPSIVFAMNAIAIIPLAGLLSYATESVAHSLGDAVGALLNITFGNAVELIIFVALVKNEIRIVQASLLGSILANLLLILGMAFFLGGLRFREQIYNSTVTQMSACLLSLSVISLVLPTAFHASFADTTLADAQSLKISRGTSIILLLVYGIYLLFQLKSHAYMYESTPQDLIDAESTPGPAVAWFDSSSSDDDSSSSSGSDSSGRSRETVSKRVKRVIRGNRRRKSSLASVDTIDTGTRTASFGASAAITPQQEDATALDNSINQHHFLKSALADGDESAIEEERPYRRHKHSRRSRHFRKHAKKFHSDSHGTNSPAGETIDELPEVAAEKPASQGEPRRVDFALQQMASNEEGTTEMTAPKRPFDALRNISLRPVARNLTPTVFAAPPLPVQATPAGPTGPVPRVRYGIRRTNSLPDRLNAQFRPPGAMLPAQIPLSALAAPAGVDDPAKPSTDAQLSRTSAILLLLISTGLVAVCAEFMVASINGLVATSPISEAFIGLIILPIVGNAAEHVTAITVAMKNKMDLAIGVAVGSSIQIALFITPLVVILGWILEREMSLYFTLFETVCLFVSTFIVNFLVLDGRSNYLEGALLCATYVIISVVAFYYPNPEDASAWGA